MKLTERMKSGLAGIALFFLILLDYPPEEYPEGDEPEDFE